MVASLLWKQASVVVMNKTKGIVAGVFLAFGWLLNFAALLGFFLLRRRMNSPLASDNNLRFFIVRPYKTDPDPQGRIVVGTERDELELMGRLALRRCLSPGE